MFEFTETMLKDLFYENDTLSLTRVLAFGGFASFIGGSAYLMINNITWSDYTVFASYTGGAGLALQFGNKFINSKYNSLPGSYDDANHNGVPDVVEAKPAATQPQTTVTTTTVPVTQPVATPVPVQQQAPKQEEKQTGLDKVIEGAGKVGQVVNTVKDTTEKLKDLKDGLGNLTKLVRK